MDRKINWILIQFFPEFLKFKFLAFCLFVKLWREEKQWKRKERGRRWGWKKLYRFSIVHVRPRDVRKAIKGHSPWALMSFWSIFVCLSLLWAFYSTYLKVTFDLRLIIEWKLETKVSRHCFQLARLTWLELFFLICISLWKIVFLMRKQSSRKSTQKRKNWHQHKRWRKPIF